MYEVEFKHAYCYTKRSVRRSTFNEMFGPLVQVQIRAVMREKRTKGGICRFTHERKFQTKRP